MKLVNRGSSADYLSIPLSNGRSTNVEVSDDGVASLPSDIDEDDLEVIRNRFEDTSWSLEDEEVVSQGESNNSDEKASEEVSEGDEELEEDVLRENTKTELQEIADEHDISVNKNSMTKDEMIEVMSDEI